MFVSSAASNALLTKCRAMFGRRLTKENISDLLACRTVQEVASYLKQNTQYAPALENINEQNVHRSQLETELDKQLFYEYASLCRYELSVGENLSQYIILRTEMRQLLSFLRLLTAGRPQEYLFTLPYFFEQHTVVKLMELSQVTDYAGFLEVVRKSYFYPVLRKMIDENGHMLDYAHVEHALYSALFDHTLASVEKHYRGKAKTELAELFGARMDLMNFLSIYRLKKFYNADSAYIASFIFPHYYKISSKLLREMIHAQDAQQVLDLFFTKTPYRKLVSRDEMENLHKDFIVRRILYKTARRYLRFSTCPSVVLVSFIELTETEFSEIVTIIEGIRYGLAPDQIANMIVFDD